MSKRVALTASVVLGLAGAAAVSLTTLTSQPSDSANVVAAARPVWTEVKWPFPIDQWGTGRAFNCKASDCGGKAKLYLRAKIGFCDCTSGVADDADLDRMSDFDLVGGEASPLGVGQPIAIGQMKGRSRTYALTARNRPGKTAISVVFNDRCDMIAATVVMSHGRPATIEHDVLEFLNSRTVLHWAEVSLGL
jgi:hypothetical protein